ncbi:MAG: dihydrodipicolinate synthase family protein [Anaerolineae bacterium]
MQIARGVWPTMVTPFTEADALDDVALAELVGWYLNHGVDGLFAVCQSSEMFFLTLAERLRLARRVVELVDGRVEVIASGHVSADLDRQVDEVLRMADTGVDAVVLVTNRLAFESEPDDRWKQNLEILLSQIPESIRLGFYECPYPYRRPLTPELMAWCAETGRFVFLKDTSCDLNEIEAKLAVAGEILLYNANAATLLGSLQAGAAGYSGVMGNIHPQLYAWLCRQWEAEPTRATELQAFLGVSSAIEARAYPVCAKYYLQQEGVPISLHTRTRPASDLIYSFRREMDQLRLLTLSYAASYAL